MAHARRPAGQGDVHRARGQLGRQRRGLQRVLPLGKGGLERGLDLVGRLAVGRTLLARQRAQDAHRRGQRAALAAQDSARARLPARRHRLLRPSSASASSRSRIRFSCMVPPGRQLGRLVIGRVVDSSTKLPIYQLYLSINPNKKTAPIPTGTKALLDFAVPPWFLRVLRRRSPKALISGGPLSTDLPVLLVTVGLRDELLTGGWKLRTRN